MLSVFFLSSISLLASYAIKCLRIHSQSRQNLYARQDSSDLLAQTILHISTYLLRLWKNSTLHLHHPNAPYPRLQRWRKKKKREASRQTSGQKGLEFHVSIQPNMQCEIPHPLVSLSTHAHTPNPTLETLSHRGWDRRDTSCTGTALNRRKKRGWAWRGRFRDTLSLFSIYRPLPICLWCVRGVACTRRWWEPAAYDSETYFCHFDPPQSLHPFSASSPELSHFFLLVSNVNVLVFSGQMSTSVASTARDEWHRR